MAVAVGDDPSVGGDAGLLQALLQRWAGQQAQVAIVVHQLQPVQVDGAGDVAVALRRAGQPPVFGVGAGIPDEDVGIFQGSRNVLGLGSGGGREGGDVGGGAGSGAVGGQRGALVGTGAQAVAEYAGDREDHGVRRHD